MNAGCLVVLYAPRALEDAIVDLLLSLEAGQGFSSFPVNRHHHESQGLSLAEQVSGRQQQVCFQIQTGEQASTCCPADTRGIRRSGYFLSGATLVGIREHLRWFVCKGDKIPRIQRAK